MCVAPLTLRQIEPFVVQVDRDDGVCARDARESGDELSDDSLPEYRNRLVGLQLGAPDAVERDVPQPREARLLVGDVELDALHVLSHPGVDGARPAKAGGTDACPKANTLSPISNPSTPGPTACTRPAAV